MTYRPPRGDLISTPDLAIRWGVSEQRIWQIARKPSFPIPVKIEAPRTRLWAPWQIEQWETQYRTPKGDR
jgi:predicted DNA-binding transcriptional regulator AlpA